MLTGLLPGPLAWKYAQIEPYGLFILIGLLFLVPFAGESLGLSFNPIASILLPPIQFMYELILTLAGVG